MAQQDSLQTFKNWIFPGLVSILGVLIWQDVTEIKQDVKALMAQSNIDKTRIDNLERAVFKTQITIPNPPNKLPSQVIYHEMVAIKPENDEEPTRERKLLEHF